MPGNKMPDTSTDLLQRIRLVRRDMGDLLFHFTRTPEVKTISRSTPGGGMMYTKSSAFTVLQKILSEGNS